MENGKYLLKHKMLQVGYHLIVNDGIYKLLNAKTDEFIKYTTLDKVNEFCEVVKKYPSGNKLWNLAYYINGKLIETIKTSAPYAIAITKARTLQRTTHKSGKVVPVPVN